VSMAMYCVGAFEDFSREEKGKMLVLLCETASTSHTNYCVTTVLLQLCSSILPIQSI